MKRNTEEAVADDMTVDGFLSVLLDQHRPLLIAEHPAWFDYARRLNRLAVGAWVNHPIMRKGLHPMAGEPLAVRLMARSMNGFAGAVIMLERGMSIEAGTLARGVYETGFWLNFVLKNEQEAIHWLLIDEHQSRKGRLAAYAKLYENNPKMLAKIKLDQVENDEKTKEMPRPLGPEAVAKRGEVPHFYPYYKRLCGSHAHASVNSTDHYLEFFDDGTTGHTLGPDIPGMARIMAFACHGMLLSAFAYVKIIDAKDSQEPLLALAQEFFAMSKDFESGMLD